MSVSKVLMCENVQLTSDPSFQAQEWKDGDCDPLLAAILSQTPVFVFCVWVCQNPRTLDGRQYLHLQLSLRQLGPGQRHFAFFGF